MQIAAHLGVSHTFIGQSPETVAEANQNANFNLPTAEAKDKEQNEKMQ